MAVLMQAKVPGMGAADYDGLNAGIGLVDQIASFPGYGGFHAAGPIDGGWQVFEIWESEAAHKNWIQTVILPTLPPQAGTAMETTYHQLHNVA